MSDYSELKRLAEAALNDPLDCIYRYEQALGSFSSAANPAAVLALIAENERLERLALDSVNAEHAANMDLESICAERDQLRAENAGLRTGYQAYERVKAEVEGLRKALTYIRDTSDDWHVCENAADALADAAMGKGEQL